MEENYTFRAPLGKSTIIITIFALLVLLIATVAMWMSPSPLPEKILVVSLIFLIIVLCYLYSIKGYSIDHHSIHIYRPIGTKSYKLDQFTEIITGLSHIKKSLTLRLWGNGGLFSITGLFWNKKLGKFKAYLSDPSKCIILIGATQKIAISPDPPEEFVKTLKMHRPNIKVIIN